MRRLIFVLLLLLVLVRPCLSAGPNIEYMAEEIAGPAVLQLPLELWIEASGQWQLTGQAADGLAFLDQDGSALGEGILLSGRGPIQETHMLVVYFDLELLGEGSHELHLQLVLQGAQGVLALPLHQDTWLLPLNNHGVQVQRDSETYCLASGEWFLTRQGDRVFQDGRELRIFGAGVEAAGAMAERSDPDFRWGTVPFSLAAGDRSTVTLRFNGPSLGEEMVLNTNSNMLLSEFWTINGQPLEAVEGTKGGLIVRLPPLPPGEHELAGSVQALLPVSGGQGEIRAIWRGREIFRTVDIERSWFDHGGTQSIRVKTTSPLLLPNGRVQRVGGEGSVAVEKGRLNAVIPLENPAEPIWTGLPLGESVLWNPQPLEDAAADWFLPVLIWDRGLHWRLVTKSGPWFTDCSPERQRFFLEGTHGTLTIENSSAGPISASFAAGQKGQSEGPWHWREEADLRYGSYRQGNWLWTVAIPRKSGLQPFLTAAYSGEKLGLHITPEDIAFRISNPAWAWGAAVKSGTLWVEKLQPGIQLEMSSGRLELRYGQDAMNLRLKLEPGELEVEYRDRPWEAYLRLKEGRPEAGVRFRQGFAQGQIRSVAAGALQIKNGLLLWEAAGEIGYELAPWCTAYLEGSLAVSNSWRERVSTVDFLYGGGVVFKPLPQLVAAAGWNNKEDWHFKAGVVLPLVGRK